MEMKKDIKEFIKIALKLHSVNPELFKGYKNRMLGAIEVQKIIQEQELV